MLRAAPPAVRLVATAGHVDHGKSTLVRALTGVDPDRLPEERARGLTIDLGFASTVLPSGNVVSFVDVPGHERLISNMLAGVGGIDACLFTVAGTEGWKPQSEEHLQVLELLGTTDALVAITKVAALDGARVAEVRRQVLARFAAGPVVVSSAVEVDVPAGLGVEQLRGALDDLFARLGSRGDEPSVGGGGRLWVDRSFVGKGSGTVVTGTLTGGPFSVGDALEVSPGPAPSYRPTAVRVRALETHGMRLDVSAPTGRVAVNLAGVAARSVRRGQALVRPRRHDATTVFDAGLHVLAGLGHDIDRRGAYVLHVGTAHLPVRIRLLGEASSIAPGADGLVRVWLPRPMPLVIGDRYVLRESGRSETVGGGALLDLAPVLPLRRAQPDGTVERLVEERGAVEVSLLERWLGRPVDPNVGDRWRASDLAVEEARWRAGQGGAAELTAFDRAVAGSCPAPAVVPQPEADPVAAWLATLEQDLFAPPSPASAGVAKDDVARLVRAGAIVSTGGLYFVPAALERAGELIGGLLEGRDEGVSISAIRDVLGTSRKFAVPLLAELDARGVTRRRADLRVAGPRLARMVR